MIPIHSIFAISILTLIGQTVAYLDKDLSHANHIFNAIHDSMRQFGSSLNHNGMSIFLATVPKDTELYHGNAFADQVNGTEWLAFEPEHALMFARGPIERPPDSPRDDPNHVELSLLSRQISRGGLQMVLNDNEKSRPPPIKPGYLHTYRTKHDLRLLYVDGQSAAKSDKGTLDVQDYILLPEPASGAPGEWLPFDDYARAQGICKVAATEWEDQIDGIIRMEAGFEIILCDFEKHLDVVRIVRAKSIYTDYELHELNENMLNYYKAVAARYNGIGGGRVRLGYDTFITLYGHSEAMYFNDEGLPRIDNNSKAITNVRDLVGELAMSSAEVSGTNWQAVSDLVVARYAHRIPYLASGAFSNLTEFKKEVDRAIRPFIDYDDRNRTAEVERCSKQFLPDNTVGAKHLPSAQQTILHVTTTICATLSSVMYDDLELSSALQRVKDLKMWLNWSDWKRCSGCSDHEVCFLAIWPLGNKEDLEAPRCRSDIINVGYHYWLGDWEPPNGTSYHDL